MSTKKQANLFGIELSITESDKMNEVNQSCQLVVKYCHALEQSDV